MIQLPQEFQHPLPSLHALSPNVDPTPTVPREDELVLEPFVARAFVKSACVHEVVRLHAHVLVENERPVDGVEHHVRSAAEHDVASHVVDRGALDPSCEGQFPDKFEPVEVPYERLSISRDRHERAECFGHGDGGNRCLVPEQAGAGKEFDRSAGRCLYGKHGNNTILPCRDERLGVGEGDAGDLSDMEVLKQTGELRRVRKYSLL